MTHSERIKGLASIYSLLTINTREFFLPDAIKGQERAATRMLQGINELHHTLANWLVNSLQDASKAFPIETLGQQLSQIDDQYRLERWLTSAMNASTNRSRS